MFTFPGLLWFLPPLVGLVVLIHLINMFRHRRVRWAAMEFLLASYRKSRTRLLLQQLLLMLLRVLAVALVVLAVAQPKFEGAWNTLLAGKASHHLILLDDSYSMNDRNAAQGGARLFDDAIGVIDRIVQAASKRNKNDRFSLVRLSRAAAIEQGGEPEISELPLDDKGRHVIDQAIRSLHVSQNAQSPQRLFSVAETLVRQSATRYRPIVYFLSDFRLNDWENADATLETLRRIRTAGASVRMVRAADEQRPNLGIEQLRLVDGIHAADVELLLDATIVNHGQEDIDQVHVAVLLDDRPQPPLTIPRVRAGGRTVPPVRFPVRLDGSGTHKVELQLPPDSISDDNRRFMALEVRDALQALLVAPDNRTGESESSAAYVRVALSPGGTRSGIRTRREPPSFLSGAALSSFQAIFLLDVPQLEPAAVQALEKYVQSGGGLAIFTGPESDPAFLEESLYKKGAGLFPFPPVAVATLDPDFLSRTPDVLVVENHPIFRLFESGESSLLNRVRVEHYLAVRSEREDRPEGAAIPKVLATLRNGAPLIVEQEYGKGRIVTFLTSAAPVWNNWARGNPSFVVVMLELAARLAGRSGRTDSLLIGDPIPWSIDPSLYESKIRVTEPAPDEQTDPPNVSLEAVADEKGRVEAVFTGTDLSGFYTATLKSHGGEETQTAVAVNVDASEGDTNLADLSRLGELLRSAHVSLESAAGFSAASDPIGEHSWSDLFLYAVLLLLVGETFLAGRIVPPLK